MAPRTSSASSASQPGGRRRRGQPDAEDEDDVNPISEDEIAETGKGGLSEEDLRKKSAKLIRFAFAMERTKKPLKRGETGQFITNSRQFPAVLARAQENLKRTFGMELVELKPRFQVGDEVEMEKEATQAATQAATKAATQKKGKGKRLQDIDEDDEDEDDDDSMPQAKKKAKPKATGFYVLRSTLSPALLQQTANPQPFPPADPENPEEDPLNGSLIDWEHGDSTQTGHIALLGLRTVILCLIMANNRVLSDENLHIFLKRLGIERDTPLPFLMTTSTNRVVPTLDKFLDLLATQLYLQKIKIPTPGMNESHSVEWRWGQRQAEFSEVAAAKFIEEIMFQGRDEEEDTVGRRRQAPIDGVASVKEQRKTMRKNLERATGGNLQGEE